jgi:predicted MFS family arabinose efflux permease
MPLPLHYRAFRVLWGAALIANICLWMQNVGAAWLMVSLGASPFLVALTQTATTLPAFFFGLPAGVLADLIDRRWLLVCIHVWILVGGCLLLALVWFGTVPPQELAQAIALNSIGYNAARAIGPGVAGVIIAAQGVEAVFAVTVMLLMLALGLFVFRYQPAFVPAREPEPMPGAIMRGVGYVLQAASLHGYLLRVVAFTACASGLWALLPLVPAAGVRGEGGTYGYLLGCLGVGAVLGGLSVGRLGRWNISLDTKVLGASLVFVVAMLVVAWIDALTLVYSMLVLAGMAWINFTSPLNSAFQRQLPVWVRARAIAIFLLAFQGSMAIGGVFWGFLANSLGVSEALSLASLCAILSMMLARSVPISTGAT